MKFKKILVTGATGFMGRHIAEATRAAYTDAEVIGVGSEDYDLRCPEQSTKMIQEINPDAVIHLAAKVGGIIANKNYPADFFTDNIQLVTQTFNASYKHGVKKFLTLIGGCSYPTTVESPISEVDMWEGFPAAESAPYSLAKRMALIQSDAYRKQYGFNSLVLIPGNVYGEYDNFNEEYSHVIPALIRRFCEARDSQAPTIGCYGSGRPTRDFVYAGDTAKHIAWFLEHYDSSEPINISSGTRTSIQELAETIQKLTGYAGQIEWDTSKPDGHLDKIFNVDRLQQLGLHCDTSLNDGLKKTIDWYMDEVQKGMVRL